MDHMFDERTEEVEHLLDLELNERAGIDLVNFVRQPRSAQKKEQGCWW